MADNFRDDTAATPPPAEPGVTPAEAAVLLGVSERTILRRLKEGELRGEKVNAGRGKVWRVLLDGMVATPPNHSGAMAAIDATSDTCPDVMASTTPALAEFAHAVIDELRQEYRDQLERLQRENAAVVSRNEQLAGQLGFLQAKLQDAERQIALLSAPKEEAPSTDEPAPAAAPRRPWWRRILTRE